MKDYFRIYMQKEGDGNEVKDSIADFGMYVSESPFKPYDAVKEPIKREWHDEHGDDEYIGKDGLYGGIREQGQVPVQWGCLRRKRSVRLSLTISASLA